MVRREPRFVREEWGTSHEMAAEEVLDPVESAKTAGLRYVSDEQPGIRRRRAGRGFTYAGRDGTTIRDAEELRRIRSLAIPPAWTDVWICPSPRGHIQATGRDVRRRKQYRYHPRWRKVRDEAKYGRMVEFAQALPTIRARAQEDLSLRGLPREKVLATVVQLLQETTIRVGNEEYAKQNASFGLTTMRDRHVEVEGSKLRFEFRGKGGKRHTVPVTDRRLARVVKQCQEIPGQELFQYLDEDGNRRSIDSADVNEYLREISGADFTAKDFRTWAGTVAAALALEEFEAFDSEAQAKSHVVRAIETVAEALGNTPAVSRKCYVHPEIIESYMDGSLLEALRRRAEQELADSLRELRPEEAAILALLQQRLTRETEERSGSGRAA
ncbi:DNA topoisomerase IB [soil metagenome]